MQRSSKRFPLELKEKVLAASEVYGRSSPSISAEYGVPEHTVRRWVREHRQLPPIHLKQSHEISKFVEVSLEGTLVPATTVLEKASLTFKGVSLTLEGNIKSTSLIGIIKILEETC
jgi:transposase-like protein